MLLGQWDPYGNRHKNFEPSTLNPPKPKTQNPCRNQMSMPSSPCRPLLAALETLGDRDFTGVEVWGLGLKVNYGFEV